MNILSVSAETHPFSRTGGMGDVCGALPIALAQRGHRVVCVSPRYGGPQDSKAWDSQVEYSFWLFGRSHTVRYYTHEDESGVFHVLIGSPLFEREGLYGDQHGSYGDNLLRFALLCRAALELPRRLPLPDGELLGEEIVLHCHDWSSSLAIAYLEALYKPLGLYPGVRSVLTLHNVAHQGRFPAAEFGGLDLPVRYWGALDSANGQILSCLEAGIRLASDLVAVSPSYALELCQPGQGFGLESLFRMRLKQGSLHGVLNGIDMASWDPAADEALAAPFSVEDLEGRAECKAALQREFGLPVRPDVPLFGLVSRLDYQKGIDLLLQAAPWLRHQDLQFVALGTGSREIADGLRRLQAMDPSRFRVSITFDGPLSRRIYAGTDFCLIPSRFEPCGLTQMYGMRYGSIPVARSTGGLKDTIPVWNPETQQGKGWLFSDPSSEALVHVLGWALHTWKSHPEAIQSLQRSGMMTDWSWESAAEKYERIYRG